MPNQTSSMVAGAVVCALFSLVDAVLLKSLPVKAPKQLVLFRWVSGERMMMHSFSGMATRGGGTLERTFTSGEIGTTANRWVGDNRSGWSNPEYDRLYVESNGALNLSVRLSEEGERFRQRLIIAAGAQISERGVRTDEVRTLQNSEEAAVVCIERSGAGGAAARHF